MVMRSAWPSLAITVGGAMSWGEPKSLAPFPETSPFFGLVVPEDVTVSSQVLAQPDPDLPQRTLAALADGTPLVTRREIADAVKSADVVMILLPDEQIAAVYNAEVAPNIKAGASLAFAHRGFPPSRVSYTREHFVLLSKFASVL